MEQYTGSNSFSTAVYKSLIITPFPDVFPAQGRCSPNGGLRPDIFHFSFAQNCVDWFPLAEQVVIAMDFMEGGSLTDTLGPTVDFKETYIAYVCREILLALAFMHHQFRLHRDIKSDNVLVRCGIFFVSVDFLFVSFVRLSVCLFFRVFFQ